jgi:hypothetical protein
MSHVEERRWIVRCFVPTVYQLRSLTTLMGGFTKMAGGSYYEEIEFDSEDDAVDWMKRRASIVHDEATAEEMADILNRIEQDGMLDYDAATARIMCVDEEGRPID